MLSSTPGNLRSHLFHLSFMKLCSICVWRTSFRFMASSMKNKAVRRKTKTKKQKIHKNHEVVKYVTEYFHEGSDSVQSKGVLNISKNDILYKLLTNSSQLLGFNVDELSKRVDLFRAAGIAFNDSILLSLAIPSCFHVNNSNFKNVIKIMQRYALPVEEILYNNPYVGGFEHVQVEKNLKFLNELKLTTALSSLISKYPILLSYQLNKNALSMLEKSLVHFDESSTVLQYLQMPLDFTAVENKVVKKLRIYVEKGMELTKDAEEFFMNYDIDIERLYQMCPDIFISTKDTLEKSLDCVLSAPFYFDVDDVEKLIMSYPDVFISFHHENVIAQVQYIEKITNVKSRLYKLLSDTPELFRDPEKFFQRVALFKKYHFKDADIARLLARKGAVNCFLDCDDYTDQSIADLLNIYLDPGDLKPFHIILSSPICLSTKALSIVEKRLKFVRFIGKVKEIPDKWKTKKNQLTLQRIIKSDSKKFVIELCERTMEEFEEFTVCK